MSERVSGKRKSTNAMGDVTRSVLAITMGHSSVDGALDGVVRIAPTVVVLSAGSFHTAPAAPLTTVVKAMKLIGGNVGLFHAEWGQRNLSSRLQNDLFRH